MTIDINKVKEAQNIIKETEKELMLFVKQYFENPKEGEVLLTENSRVNSEWKDFNVNIQMKELCVTVQFHYREDNGNWTYKIACPELKIYSFEPPTDNKLTIQGTIVVRLKDKTKILIAGGATDVIVEYDQKMNMAKYNR